MIHRLKTTALVGVAVLALGVSAQAQIAYPGGYGGYGWGGWGGGWGGGGTVQGDIARGMGAFAAGAGYYNESTAVANSINANTAMNWNEYWWQSQQNLNRQYYARMAARRDSNNQSQKQIFERLRDNPTPRDIYRGDAMNQVLDTLSNPKIYIPSLKTSATKFPGDMIRDTPFRYNAANITASVHGVFTKGSAPDALKVEALKPEMTKLRELAQQGKAEFQEDGEIDVATLDQFDEALAAAQAKVAQIYADKQTERLASQKFLRAAQGLSKMLRTPAINVLLSDVDKHPEVTVADLLGFMRAFNLRFGSADTPRERMVYDQLYPLLVRMRDEAMPNSKPQLPEEDFALDHNHTAEFFDKMADSPKALSTKQVAPPPVPPAPGATNRGGPNR